MKAWMWAACLLMAPSVLWAQSAAPTGAHDAYHQQPPAASPFGKAGPALREKRKQGVSPAATRTMPPRRTVHSRRSWRIGSSRR
jgi:hypothetical protein